MKIKTGPLERVVPEQINWLNRRLLLEHQQRYDFALPFVQSSIVGDIACGSGFGSFKLHSGGAKQVIGIDNSDEAIEYAQKKYRSPGVKFINSDASHIELPDAYFDTIVSYETLEHLLHPSEFLIEMRRLIKTGGFLLISTPNQVASLKNNPFHTVEYTFSEFNNILSGWELISIYGQRPVNMNIFNFLKKISQTKLFSSISNLISMRPWEKLTIEKIESGQHTNYLYFIAVCKKK